MELVITRRSPDGTWSDELPDWDSASTLVQVFGPSSLLDDHSPLAEVDARYPTSIVIGCSGAGVVVDEEICDGDLIVAVARFKEVKLSAVFDTVSSAKDQNKIGEDMQKKLYAKDSQVNGIILLSSGLATDGDSLAAGFEGANLANVGGGLAGTVPGEDGTFGATWVLDENRRPVDGAISALGFSGESLIYRNAARGGWKPLGPERIVTKADAYTLHELDDRPALDLYKEYLGDEANGLPAVASRFPLSNRPASGSDDDWAPAGVISVDEDTKSLQLTRKIVDGSQVQMLRGYSGKLFEAAENTVNDLHPIADGTHLAVVTSCLGRRVVLGSRTADELSCVRQTLPNGVGMVGFYGMGEFSSTSSTACKLYNYTMTMALIGERLS